VLFQAGPRLVWDGEAVGGLDSEALANRTVLSVDEEGRLGIVVIGGPATTTLSELPALLLKPVSQGGMEAVRALNLDGGSSTQFFLQSGSTKKSMPGRAKVPVFLGVSKRSDK
jgi:exopolysaccharide biosynthesis protein